MTGFKPYRRKGGDIKAQPITEDMTIGGVELVVGDYLILDQGEVAGAKKAEFEAKFEPVKKNYNKPKGEKKAKGETKAEASAPAAAKAS